MGWFVIPPMRAHSQEQERAPQSWRFAFFIRPVSGLLAA